jgi:hypothetical protein
MHDLWGYCSDCHRWFAIERRDLETLRLCPVCLLPAEALEQRAS